MKKIFLGLFVLATLLLIQPLCQPTVSAQELPPALKSFVSSDVVAVGFVDLRKVDAIETANWINSLGFADEVQTAELVAGSRAIQNSIDKMIENGAEKLYFPIRVSDATSGGPGWVVSVADGRDASKLLEVMKPMVKDIKAPWHFETGYKDETNPQFIEAFDGVVIGGSSKSQLAAFKNSQPFIPKELEAAWPQFESGIYGLIVFGNSDSRRVLREMLPELPAPLAGLTGTLIADRVQWMGIRLNQVEPEKTEAASAGSAKFGGTLAIKTTDDEAAGTVHKATVGLFQSLKSKPPENPFLDADAIKSLVTNIEPLTKGSLVAADLDALFANASNVTDLIKPGFDATRMAERKKSMRDLAIAMLNYESAYRAFPTQAIYSAEQKPLLSWRVAILPFLGELALYKEFKLDEPWDSEHNIKLVKKMPKVFADRDPALAGLMREGKTMFQVPYHDQVLFHGTEGMTFPQMTDGSSNTIAIIQVQDAGAVEWTKPVDWNVDLNEPMKGIDTNGKRDIVFALADGWVGVLNPKVSAETLKAALCFEDGQIFKNDLLKK